MTEEEIPILSDKTLGDVKKELSADANVMRFAFKRAMASTKQPAYFFDLLIYELSVGERAAGITDEINKRQFRLYVEDWGNDINKEDASRICWDGKMRWKPTTPSKVTTPEPTFTNRLEAYIKAKIDDDTIKVGFVVQVSELRNKAICNVILPDKTDKTILVSEDAKGAFSFEVLV